MISQLSKYGAASSAKRIIKIAPIAKFGAITALADERSNRSAKSASSASLNPVVPTTACTPFSAHQREVLAGGVDHREVDRNLRARVEQRARARRDLDLRAVHAELTEVDARVQRIDGGDELHARARRAPPGTRSSPCARRLRTPRRGSDPCLEAIGRQPGRAASVRRRTRARRAGPTTARVRGAPAKTRGR